MKVVILAAGRSSRFNSSKSKLLHLLGDRLIVNWVVSSVLQAGLEPVVILGYQAIEVRAAIEESFPGRCKFVEQKEQCGTGHAFSMVLAEFGMDDFLVLNGDVPLLPSSELSDFAYLCSKDGLDVGLIISQASDPFGYGRILFENGNIHIIEEKDACPPEKEIRLINAGIYYFSKKYLDRAFDGFWAKYSARSGEVNITDLVNYSKNLCGIKFSQKKVPFEFVRGINTREQYLDLLQSLEDSPNVLLQRT